jgi:hypothetical protein
LAFVPRCREPSDALVRQRDMGLGKAASGGCMFAWLLVMAACGSGAAQTAPVAQVAAGSSCVCRSKIGFCL